MRKGIPFIIAAPSGAGKTSLVKALLASMPNLTFSISHTTRAMRPGEVRAVDYHFITPTQFEYLLTQDAFLEYAKVFGHYYGTSWEWVKAQLDVGIDVLFEIDWQGAQQLRKKLPGCVSIFIVPPSLEVLRQRLLERGQDDPIIISDRMQQAKNELSHYNEFDYLVVNESFIEALEDLKAIIRSCRLKTSVQREELADLLANLLA